MQPKDKRPNARFDLDSGVNRGVRQNVNQDKKIKQPHNSVSKDGVSNPEGAFFENNPSLKQTQTFNTRQVQNRQPAQNEYSARNRQPQRSYGEKSPIYTPRRELKNSSVRENFGHNTNTVNGERAGDSPSRLNQSRFIGKEGARRAREAALRRKRRKKEHMRTFSHITISIALIAVIMVSSALLSQFIVRAFLDYTGISIKEFQVTISIPPNSTTDDIADILYENKIISMPKLFTLYSEKSEKDEGYLGGSFDLSSTMSYSQIIKNLQNVSRGSETVMVEIIEGMTLEEIAKLLEDKKVCKYSDFISVCKERFDIFSFELRVEKNPLRLNQMEGYLFPDTHEFFTVNGLESNSNMDTTEFAKVAAKKIFSHFNSQISPEMYRKMADMGFTLDEFITLASIIQWEAAEYDDMRGVASVLLNRLRNPEDFPKLESNATEKYINQNLKPYKETIDKSRYESMTAAYDTHRSNGLPPGPICNPGLEAMLAILDAPESDNFYFCANVNTKEVFFAATLSEHEANLIEAGIDPETNTGAEE